jgi:mRNA interferase YafQ
MRRIEHTTAFRRDFKREKAGQHGRRLDALLARVVTLLAKDMPLPAANRDHPLSGEWSDCRDCHLRPDPLLLYRKPDAETLQLVRLGSHSELFG